MENYRKYPTIREWAEADRPREKLLLKGRHNLSDAELLAILIGSGTREQSALELARQLLAQVTGNLKELGKLDIRQLTQIKGMGPVRAITIMAALELGKRRQASVSVERTTIKRSEDAYQVFRHVMGEQPYEVFWILILNRANHLISRCCISEGGVSGTVVDPKKIFKVALDHHASGIILGHNHPSGNLRPSESDIRITSNLLEGGKLLEISVLDHLIVTDDGFFSFADEGMLNN